jgi:hypothetical protein
MADYTIMVMGEALSQTVRKAAPRARLHVRLIRVPRGASDRATSSAARTGSERYAHFPKLAK